MKVVLMGSRGHVAKPLTDILVSKGIDTTVITRSEDNAKLIRESGATAAVGSGFDKEFLTKTFRDADCVFVLLAGDIFLADALDQMIKQDTVICDAILESAVENVVYLSSIGSDSPDLGFHYYCEEVVKKKLGGLRSVVFVRPTGFFTNLFNYISTLKSQKAIYSNSPRNQVLTFVHPDDIAKVCADLILTPELKEKFKIIGVESDRADAVELEKLFSDALGTDIKYITISDDDALAGFMKLGITKENGKKVINFYSDKYHNEAIANVNKHTNVIGTHKLADYLKTDFVAVYNS